VLFADVTNVIASHSQHVKVKNSGEDGDNDDDDDDEMATDDDDSDQEDAVDSSGTESAADDDHVVDDNGKPGTENTRAAKKDAVSPTKARKQRLQELEHFVESKSTTAVKGILKGSTPASASTSKLVKFADDNKTGAETVAPVYHEDIYGRLRDEHGNIVNPDDVAATGRQVGMYVPPGKRQKLAEESASRSIDKLTDESLQRVEMLTRQVKGQINRSD